MIIALISTGTVLFITVIGSAWHLSGRLTRVETKVELLEKTLNGHIQKENQ
jgi:hypothetical protein